MNRRALFISVILTVFVIAMLSGIFTIYKAFASTTTVSNLETGTGIPTMQTENQVADQASANQVTPTEAATIAGRYINRQDVYMVEAAVLDNMNVYKVTFSSGDLVYVSLDGQVLLVQQLPKYPVYSSGSTSSTVPSHYDEHEDESEHDDD